MLIKTEIPSKLHALFGEFNGNRKKQFVDIYGISLIFFGVGALSLDIYRENKFRNFFSFSILFCSKLFFSLLTSKTKPNIIETDYICKLSQTYDCSKGGVGVVGGGEPTNFIIEY